MTTTIRTRVSELLGVRYPIVQGGMMWVGRAELAAAVSNAGAFGILTALTQPTPEALRHEIRRCRGLTDRPFGVNLTMLPSIDPPPYEQYLDAILDCDVPVIETAGKVPEAFFAKAKRAGAKIIHKCRAALQFTAAGHGCERVRVGAAGVRADVEGVVLVMTNP